MFARDNDNKSRERERKRERESCVATHDSYEFFVETQGEGGPQERNNEAPLGPWRGIIFCGFWLPWDERGWRGEGDRNVKKERRKSECKQNRMRRGGGEARRGVTTSVFSLDIRLPHPVSHQWTVALISIYIYGWKKFSSSLSIPL